MNTREEIAVQWHGERDGVYDEDRSPIRTGHAPGSWRAGAPPRGASSTARTSPICHGR